METVIYVDVLVVLNFIITYLLLLCTASALRLSPSAVRLFFGSLLGGVSSLMIFLPPLPLPLTLVCKAAICALITLTALPAGSLRLFLRNGAFFLLTNVLFAGIIFALMCIFSPGGVVFSPDSRYTGPIIIRQEVFPHAADRPLCRQSPPPHPRGAACPLRSAGRRSGRPAA